MAEVASEYADAMLDAYNERWETTTKKRRRKLKDNDEDE